MALKDIKCGILIQILLAKGFISGRSCVRNAAQKEENVTFCAEK